MIVIPGNFCDVSNAIHPSSNANARTMGRIDRVLVQGKSLRSRFSSSASFFPAAIDDSAPEKGFILRLTGEISQL